MKFRYEITAAALTLISGAQVSLAVAGNPTPINLNSYYTATISSGASQEGQSRLSQYLMRLRELLGAQNLEEEWVGCIECEPFEAGTPKPQLSFIFYREHERSRNAIVQAWQDVHSGTAAMGAINDFKIQIDSVPLPSKACPPSPPAPAGCTPVVSCILTDRCDKSLATPGCQKCQ